MSKPYLVKIGLMGMIGRYDAPDYRQYERDAQVICRTPRGLEVGRVLCDLNAPGEARETEQQGQLLRSTTAADELLLERLQRHRDRAFQACENLLKERQIDAILVDVEHLFDGESIFFYFLGEVPAQVHDITARLGDLYEQKVKFRKFRDTLRDGCGPGCGTSQSGCSSQGCGQCSLSGGCGARSRQSAGKRSKPAIPDPIEG
ncbi:MAG: PSP1 C-terminal domain-containing protein [Planctomycetota bacterium]|nr:PSP1 C-terminal domain-containing protein [Planctomycetota bacterium]